MTRALGYLLTAVWIASVLVAVGTGQPVTAAQLLVVAAVVLVVWAGVSPPDAGPDEHEGWEDHDAELVALVQPLPDHPLCLGCLTRPARRPEMACRRCQRSYVAAYRRLQHRRPAAVRGAR